MCRLNEQTEIKFIACSFIIFYLVRVAVIHISLLVWLNSGKMSLVEKQSQTHLKLREILNLSDGVEFTDTPC